MIYLQTALDWSEVWSTLIPIAVFLVYNKQPSYCKPVVVYIFAAFFLNLLANYIWLFPDHRPTWLTSNNFVYNLHSVVRFYCFVAFFIRLNQPYMVSVKKILPVIAGVFLLINFIFFEDFFRYLSFSSRLFTIEAGFLLLYCIMYYMYKLRESSGVFEKDPAFWIVTGLSIYVVFNFAFFLFYTTLIERGNADFAQWMWNFHNISFIILCLFIARGLYVARNR